jgi:methyl-accepting chemotaxis protein
VKDNLIKKVLNLHLTKKSSKWFFDKKISEKLMIIFVVVAVISSLLIGTVGIVNIVKINKMSVEIYQQNLVPLTPLYKIEIDILSIQSQIKDAAIDKSRYNINSISASQQDLQNQISQYNQYASSNDEKDDLHNLLVDVAGMMNYENTLPMDFEFGDTKDGDTLLYGGLVKTIDNCTTTVNQLFKVKTDEAKSMDDTNTIDFYISLVMMAGIVLLTAGISVIMGKLFSRSISSPLEKLVAAADSISSGNLDVDIDISSKDETGILAHAFLKIIQSLRLMKKDVDILINGALEGRLDTRTDITKHMGIYREIIGGVNKSFDAITTPLNTAADYVEAISKGNIPSEISDYYKGDFNILKNNLNTCIKAINALVTDANMLSQATVEGKLSIRADTSRHQGDFRRIIEGVNGTLDAITIPLYTAANYVNKISKGNIPCKITDDYSGDFNIIKDNLNTCIDAINALVADANMLSQAALAGNLEARVDAQRHQGDFRLIIDGVNNTLDAITAPLNTAADYVNRISHGNIPEKITENYKGDFNLIKNNLNTCIDAIKGLVSDANDLSQAAKEGKLSVRADAQRHQGDFRRIIDGVNNTLDAFIDPISESAEVLNEMSKGNLKVTVKGDYKGDLAQIKNALNTTINAMSGYINEISGALSEISSGNLNVSINSDYKGDFVEIKDSINNIIVSLNETLKEIRYASDEVAVGSSQVSSGSQLLSQGATEQASSIEQLTASIMQIASQTKQNAVNAGKASEITSGVKKDAIACNGLMKKLLSAMEEINQSSSNIKKIIKVIDNIAFHTNILALNAAVEAARAGQYGKGFAVVADEVRNLAAKSASAASETTSLIENSIQKSELGMQIAGGTAKSLNKIVNVVERAAEMMDTIAEASNEQVIGVAQISIGINQISQVVQTNSATAEQSAASSEELSGQSVLLKEKVDRFRLNELSCNQRK